MDNYIFSNEKVNLGRQSELDWARGLAVLFMVLVHVKLELPGFPLSDTYSKVIELFGSPFAAPVFMALLGAGIVYSRNSGPERLAREGVKLLVMHYALNFLAFGLPNLIMFAKTGSTELLDDFMNVVFGQDILAFAGLTFLFFALVMKWHLKLPQLAIVLLILSCANYILTIPNDSFVIGAVFGLFVRVNEYSYFPFLSWIGYPVMGYIFGGFLIRCNNKKSFYKYLFCFSVLTILAISLGACKYNFDIWSMHFGPEEYYYQDYIQYFLVGGIVFSWISVLFAVSEVEAINNIGKKTVFRWSRNTTVIYFAQWIIIGWLSRLELISFPAEPLVNFITGIIIFIVCDVSTHLFLKMKLQKKPSTLT